MTTNQLITKIGRQRVVTALSNVVCSSGGAEITQSITDGDTTHSPSGDAVFDALALKLDKITTANRQTDSYTLVLGDAYKLVEMNKATANNLTVPLNSSVAFDIGTSIYISQYGAGQTTIVATGGVTINSASGSLLIPSQYAVVQLFKVGTNEWYLWPASPTVASWVDWGASLAPTGFSSLSVQKSQYKTDGNQVWMWVEITGTSNTNGLTFALPFALSSNYSANGFMVIVHGIDGATGNVVSRMYASGSGSVVTADPTVTDSTWNTSGTKSLKATFSYQR